MKAPWFLVLLVLIAAAGFLLRALLVKSFSNAAEEIFKALGLGYLFLPVWLVITILLVSRASFGFWARVSGGSLVFIVGLTSLLAFYSPPLGPFSQETLGGQLGQWLKGPSFLWGSVRVAVLFALSLGIWAPELSIRFYVWSLRKSLNLLLLIAVALGSAVMAGLGVLGRRFRPRAVPSTSPEIAPSIPSKEVPADEPAKVAPKGLGGLSPAGSLKKLLPIGVSKPASSTAGAWKIPPITLLVHIPPVRVSEADIREVAERVRTALAEHGIDASVPRDHIRPGPRVTRYGVVPGWVRRIREVKERDDHGRVKLDRVGRPVVVAVKEDTRVKVDAILAREKDLALALKASSIRLEAPVPGESVVGIEVPNPEPGTVSLRSLMESPQFQKMNKKAALPLALGEGTGGEPIVGDLAAMPHLLIAGATGSGKSVCINAMIITTLLLRTPGQVRLVLIDPKKVELSFYEDIPHLFTPVVSEVDQAIRVLRCLLHEMNQRFRAMKEIGVKNIAAYNSSPRALRRMPYVMVVIDELADLMLASPYDVEHSLCRLAQLGRGAGICLVVSTQRPSVNVVTGLIKANFPSRLSFALPSQVDSRTILDAVGAEKLLGQGDMLFQPQGIAKPQRAQGAYVSDLEIHTVGSFWKSQEGTSLDLLQVEEEEEDEGEGSDASSRDNLYDKALELAAQHTTLSTSLLQRRLRIGYPRAARLMDQLVEDGALASDSSGKFRKAELTRDQSIPPED